MADDSRPTQQRRIQPALLGGIALVAVLADFVLQNTDDVTIHFLTFSRRAPVWLLLVITSVVAIGAAEVFAFVARHRRRS